MVEEISECCIFDIRFRVFIEAEEYRYYYKLPLESGLEYIALIAIFALFYAECTSLACGNLYSVYLYDSIFCLSPVCSYILSAKIGRASCRERV